MRFPKYRHINATVTTHAIEKIPIPTQEVSLENTLKMKPNTINKTPQVTTAPNRAKRRTVSTD